MRAGELAGLEADAVVQIGAGHWLRIPLGKLRNDRYVPLHPELVQLLAAWTAINLERIRRHKRLVADHRGPLDRYVIGRIVARVARAAGVPGVHPHRLRHTLATQAINRGMRLEAIAALLGKHRKMEMTLIYARSPTGSSPMNTPRSAPRSTPSTGSHPNCQPTTRPPVWPGCAAKPTPGYPATALCTRPPQLDCRMESACETCAYFRTGPQFLPILTRQRDHAHDHGFPRRPARLPGLAELTSRPAGSTGLMIEPDLDRLDDAVEWHL
jgi:hypothetical protein